MFKNRKTNGQNHPSKTWGNVLKYEKVSGVALSSLLHYSIIQDKKFTFDKNSDGNINFLKNFSKKNFDKKKNILSIKKFLKKKRNRY